jgi:hypothetical protein
MRRYCCIKTGVVVEIQNIDEENPFIDNGYDAVFDVTDNVPEVTVGWTYDNGNIAPDSIAVPNSFASELIRMANRFKFGNQLSDEFIMLMSVRNIELGKTSAQVNTVISTFLPIEMALRKCAIPTALGGINQIAPMFPEYAELFQYASDKITTFLAGE